MTERRAERGRPLLTVITATYNRASFLPRALNSVPPHPQVEHIVVDGASTDGTFNVLSDYPHIRVISDPDKGVYDAWNKGIAAARGEFIGFLNSDDTYVKAGLAALLRALPDARQGVEVLAAGFEVVSRDGLVIRSREGATDRLGPVSVGIGTPAINARVFRRVVFDRVGGFDIGLRVAADTDFLMRCWSAGVDVSSVPAVLYRYVRHDDSLTLGDRGLDASAREEVLEVIRRCLIRAREAGSDRSALRYWRGNVLLRDVLQTFRESGGADAVRAVSRAFSVDPAWGLRAIAYRLGLTRRDLRPPGLQRDV